MVDLYRNPQQPVNTFGEVHRAYASPEDLNRRGELSSHIVEVDSRDRNRTRYPNANDFVVQLPTRYKGVYSVELLNAIIPIPAEGGATWDDAGGTACYPRYLVIKSTALQQLEGAQTTNPNQVGAGFAANAYQCPIANNGFVSLPVINNFPSHFLQGLPTAPAGLYWRKSECRVIKQYFPLLASLERIDIQLFFRGELADEYPWPFTNENADPTVRTDVEQNIHLVFEIVCKN